MCNIPSSEDNPRITMQMRNMSRKTNDDFVQLRRKADDTRYRIESGREVLGKCNPVYPGVSPR